MKRERREKGVEKSERGEEEERWSAKGQVRGGKERRNGEVRREKGEECEGRGVRKNG